MSSLKEKTARLANKIIPQYSAAGILLRALVLRSRKNLYMLQARHMMDINKLNKRIAYIKDMAGSEETSNKKFSVINVHTKNAGLFSIVLNAMSLIIYALGNKKIPVIDMRHSGIYLEEHESGIVNAWEKYFRQPCGYGLDDIDETNTYDTRYGPAIKRAVYGHEDSYQKHYQVWSALFSSFFMLNDECGKYVEDEYNRLIKPGMRVLGVFCRGTDYVKMRPSGCFIQPDVNDVINKAREAMSEWKCDYIFVTTEEKRTVDKFEENFPDKVLTAAQRYYDDLEVDYSKTYVGRISFNRENDKFLKGLEYLSSVMILSRCTCAVMGAASGSIAALYMNGGKYENCYIFNLGIY